jgi:2-octaprenyl-6-methoxyphenol hydroxylase
MMKAIDYDALIIGGGMVGASLASALGGERLKLGLVEAVPFQSDSQPSYDDRGLVLAPASQRVFAGIGIWPDLSRNVTPIRRIHVSDRGHFGFTHLDAAELGVSALGHVAVARDIGQALLSRLAALDNVDLLCPARLESVEIHPDYAEATVSEGDHTRTLTTRLLIAADGSNSRIRELLNIEADLKDYRQTAVVANVTPERAHDFTAYERFTSTGPLAVIPSTGQRCVVVWGVRTEEAEPLLALDDETFLKKLTERFGGRLGRFLKVGRRRAYPLRLIRPHRQVGPRFALIGNAAHAIHPNAAQGLNLGLRDVATLAEVLAEASRAGKDPGNEALLQTYADRRQHDHWQTIALSDGLTRLFYNDFPPLVVTRNLAMLAIDLIPPLKRDLVRRAMGLTGHQPRLVRGLSL